jgi:integrase/recombinase XerD
MNHGITDDEKGIDQWLASKRGQLTRETYNTTIGEFRRAVTVPLADVSIADVQTWIGSHSHQSAATVQRKLATVRSLFSYLMRVGYLKENPASVVTTDKPKDTLTERILDEDQVQALVTAMEGNLRNYTLIRLLYLSGGRVSEIAGLSWRDVRTAGDGAQITLFGKGQKTRLVSVPASMREDLEALRGKASPDGAVFIEKEKRMTRQQIYDVVKDAGKMAGIPAVSPHWFRHSSASHAIEAGMPLTSAKDALGHASLASTQRYIHAKKENLSNYLKIG